MAYQAITPTPFQIEVDWHSSSREIQDVNYPDERDIFVEISGEWQPLKVRFNQVDGTQTEKMFQIRQVEAEQLKGFLLRENSQLKRHLLACLYFSHELYELREWLPVKSDENKLETYKFDMNTDKLVKHPNSGLNIGEGGQKQVWMYFDQQVSEDGKITVCHQSNSVWAAVNIRVRNAEDTKTCGLTATDSLRQISASISGKKPLIILDVDSTLTLECLDENGERVKGGKYRQSEHDAAQIISGLITEHPKAMIIIVTDGRCTLKKLGEAGYRNTGLISTNIEILEAKDSDQKGLKGHRVLEHLKKKHLLYRPDNRVEFETTFDQIVVVDDAFYSHQSIADAFAFDKRTHLLYMGTIESDIEFELAMEQGCSNPIKTRNELLNTREDLLLWSNLRQQMEACKIKANFRHTRELHVKFARLIEQRG
ncbi:hypothetical protein JQC92_15290 [Shewanella sp. 202IG2-18]|uniref:hypothetical protein n=1 Tax=Parashewanella hymeniacidonis TaxID=2807618 RepID=UPI0019613245|nr:hypothetical protein [Parashewanella hymeniacidonis]MBM7073378.1 hypothetical protein [Parashewanella hymeniacidonis]